MNQLNPALAPAPIDAGHQQLALSKVMWRLIPLMCFLYLFNYLDRVNVSSAKLQIPQTLPWFTDAAYGFGAGIFFVGYALFEVPSNLIMHRVGARFWLARIMISWGIISAAMAFISQPWHFYGLRLLLGFAEAGFFPGMLLYITYWVPSRQRSKATALFMTSTALSGVVGNLLAEQLLRINGGGLLGWQWMFIIEGLPSVLLGVAILFLLPDGPANVRWLSDAEKRALANRLAADRAEMGDDCGHRFSDALRDVRVWMLCALYALLILGFYVINYWTPSLVGSTWQLDAGSAPLPPGSPPPAGLALVSAIPFLAAAIIMSLVGAWTDRTGRRRITVIVCAAVGCVGYLLTVLATRQQNTVLMVTALSLTAAGIWSTLGPFWALPSRFLHGTAVAAGLALINSIGNLIGGYGGNLMMGQLKDAYKSYEPGLWVSSGVAAAAALLAVSLPLFRLQDERRAESPV